MINFIAKMYGTQLKFPACLPCLMPLGTKAPPSETIKAKDPSNPLPTRGEELLLMVSNCSKKHPVPIKSNINTWLKHIYPYMIKYILYIY